jgi:hypothetical protein
MKKFPDSFYLIWMTVTRSKLGGMRAQERDIMQSLTNGKGDGYVTLLPVSFSLTVWVLHQKTCSKEMEGEKENKYRENQKPQHGKR